MSQVNLGKQHPAMYEHMLEFDRTAREVVAGANVDPILIELVKIRVSQLNGCAFCLRMHTRDAIAQGESSDRLAVLAAWWESQYFDEVERAALTLAEELTGLPVPARKAWDIGVLTDDQISAISWLTIVMNSWNRIAIQSHYPVGP